MIKKNTASLPRSSLRNDRDINVAKILILIIMAYVSCHGIITFLNVIEFLIIITGKTNYSSSSKIPLIVLLSFQVWTKSRYGGQR